MILRGGAVSVFYEQLGNLLPKRTIRSFEEEENLLEKNIYGNSREDDRCYIAGQKSRNKLIREQTLGTIKTAYDYKYIKINKDRIQLVN